jgi:hypothetical protein
MTSLDDQVQLFTLTAEQQAEGYSTAFHAGLAAIRRQIGSKLLDLRHDPIRLREALLTLTDT